MDSIERTFIDEDGNEQVYQLRKPTREEAVKILTKIYSFKKGEQEAKGIDFTPEFMALCVSPDPETIKNWVMMYPGLPFKEISSLDQNFADYTTEVIEKTAKSLLFEIHSKEKRVEIDAGGEEFEIPIWSNQLRFYRLKGSGYNAIISSISGDLPKTLDMQARLHLHTESHKIAEELFTNLPFLTVTIGGMLLDIATPKYIEAKKKL